MLPVQLVPHTWIGGSGDWRKGGFQILKSLLFILYQKHIKDTKERKVAIRRATEKEWWFQSLRPLLCNGGSGTGSSALPFQLSLLLSFRRHWLIWWRHGGGHPVCLRIHRSIGGAKKPVEALITLKTWEIPLKAVVSGHHEATHTSSIVYSEAHFPMCLFVFQFGWTGMWKVLKRVFCQKKKILIGAKVNEVLCKCHRIRGKRG